MSEISPVFHQRIHWITRNQNHPPLLGWTKLDSPPTVVWGVCSGLDNKLDSEGRVVDSVKIQVFRQGTAVFAAEWFFDPSVDSSRVFFPKILVFPSRKEIQFWENLQFFGGASQPCGKFEGCRYIKKKVQTILFIKGFIPFFFRQCPAKRLYVFSVSNRFESNLIQASTWMNSSGILEMSSEQNHYWLLGL